MDIGAESLEMHWLGSVNRGGWDRVHTVSKFDNDIRCCRHDMKAILYDNSIMLA